MCDCLVAITTRNLELLTRFSISHMLAICQELLPRFQELYRFGFTQFGVVQVRIHI